MESKVKYLIDASLTLSAVNAATVTADGNSTLVDIQRITGGRGDINGRYGEGSFDVVLHVVSLDHTTGDETYTLNFQTFDANGANGTTQESVTLTTADVGETKVFKFDTTTLAGVDADAAKFGIAIDTAGTSPILGYWAFVVPNRRFG